MQVEMYFDGRIQLAWLAAALDGIVGLLNGLGVPDGFAKLTSSYPCQITVLGMAPSAMVILPSTIDHTDSVLPQDYEFISVMTCHITLGSVTASGG
jgi:hypothetical protein